LHQFTSSYIFGLGYAGIAGASPLSYIHYNSKKYSVIVLQPPLPAASTLSPKKVDIKIVGTVGWADGGGAILPRGI
jgi:hypothetical protein